MQGKKSNKTHIQNAANPTTKSTVYCSWEVTDKIEIWVFLSLLLAKSLYVWLGLIYQYISY
jgi:hypothetical protein